MKQTYVIVCDNFKVKIGITTNWERRIRAYELHNQSITDYLVFNGDEEDYLLWAYRDYRIGETEWLHLDYNPIKEITEDLGIIKLITNKYETTTKTKLR